MHMDSLRCHHVQFEQKTKYSLGLERFLHENNDDGSNAQSIPYIWQSKTWSQISASSYLPGWAG
jgi:hypothetical protein